MGFGGVGVKVRLRGEELVTARHFASYTAPPATSGRGQLVVLVAVDFMSKAAAVRLEVGDASQDAARVAQVLVLAFHVYGKVGDGEWAGIGLPVAACIRAMPLRVVGSGRWWVLRSSRGRERRYVVSCPHIRHVCGGSSQCPSSTAKKSCSLSRLALAISGDQSFLQTSASNSASI